MGWFVRGNLEESVGFPMKIMGFSMVFRFQFSLKINPMGAPPCTADPPGLPSGLRHGFRTHHFASDGVQIRGRS
jgi:hypothetical protein